MPQAGATLHPGQPDARAFANTLTKDSRLVIDTTKHTAWYYLPDDGPHPITGPEPAKYQLSCSDLVTPLAIANDVAYFHVQKAFTLQQVRASVLTASTSGAITITMTMNGAPLLSTPLTIDANELSSVTAAVPAVLAITDIPDDARIRINITAAGTGAKGLICSLLGME